MERKAVEGGFLIDQEHLPGRCYVLTEPWTSRCAEVMRNEGAEYLRLNRTLGARYHDLTFLADLTALRGVEIYDHTVDDVSPLLELGQIELLGLECRFRKIDFAAHFPDLRFASFSWRPGCETLFNCRSLEFLFPARFPFEDLTPLSQLSSLRRLHIDSRKLMRFDGVQSLASIEHLTVAFCSSLDDISALTHCSGLRVLEMYSCKKVGQIAALAGLKQLRRLQIENAVQIASVAPLRQCDALEELYFPGTKIGDCDLSPLLDLPRLKRVAFREGKGDSHTNEEIEATIAARR